MSKNKISENIKAGNPNISFYGRTGELKIGDNDDYVIRTEMNGFTICDDFHNGIHERTRILKPLDEHKGRGLHLYVQQYRPFKHDILIKHNRRD